MRWYEIATLAAAIFFAGGWGLGLALSPRNRTGGNITTVCAWWVLLALALSEVFAPLHLLWAFPLALIAPALLLLSVGRL